MRSFVKCQLLFNGLCFKYYLRKTKKEVQLFCYGQKTLLTQVISKSTAPLEVKMVNYFLGHLLLIVLLFIQALQSRESSFHRMC